MTTTTPLVQQRVIERLRRGAHHFRRLEDKQLVADIAFRAWKELRRGMAIEDLLPEERTARRWAGINQHR
jgi:hypothetical protein